MAAWLLNMLPSRMWALAVAGGPAMCAAAIAAARGCAAVPVAAGGPRQPCWQLAVPAQGPRDGHVLVWVIRAEAGRGAPHVTCTGAVHAAHKGSGVKDCAAATDCSKLLIRQPNAMATRVRLIDGRPCGYQGLVTKIHSRPVCQAGCWLQLQGATASRQACPLLT